jgi:hypothetical protein
MPNYALHPPFAKCSISGKHLDDYILHYQRNFGKRCGQVEPNEAFDGNMFLRDDKIDGCYREIKSPDLCQKMMEINPAAAFWKV